MDPRRRPPWRKVKREQPQEQGADENVNKRPDDPVGDRFGASCEVLVHVIAVELMLDLYQPGPRREGEWAPTFCAEPRQLCGRNGRGRLGCCGMRFGKFWERTS